LRIAEDRGVEEHGRLKTYLRGAGYYQNLFQYFKEAHSKCNSGPSVGARMSRRKRAEASCAM